MGHADAAVASMRNCVASAAGKAAKLLMSLRHVLVLIAALAALSLLSACGGSNSTSEGAFAQCGNGRLDSGELCDDGNTSDTDDCISTCVPASCGDGVVEAGVEDCDGFDLNQATCTTLGLSGDTSTTSPLRCNTACLYDTSACGPPFTPTPTSTLTATPVDTPTAAPTHTPGGTEAATETPTPSPTPTGRPCGNGILEPGESCTCESSQEPTCNPCPEDCMVLPCTPDSNSLQIFGVDLDVPTGNSATVVSILVGYRSDRVSLPSPGTGARVKMRPSGSSQLVMDLNYAVRVVLNAGSGSSLPNGQVFTIDFDSCTDTEPVSEADFGCTVESCGSSFGTIEGCTCSVTGPLSP
jgi:cysteine-rich repeat protein